MTDKNAERSAGIPALDTSEGELLRKLVCHFGGHSFSEQGWERVGDLRRTGAERKISFIRLRQGGWIEAVKKSWGERLYYIPVDQLLRILPAYFTPVPQPLSPAGLEIRCESGPGLTLDLLHALAFAAEQGLPLTAKGTVHKKSLQRLQDMICLREEHIKPLSLQYAYQEAYGSASAVILDLMLCMGLLSKTATSMPVNCDRLRTWLSLTEQEMNRLLLRTVIERYGQSAADTQLFRYFLCMPAMEQGVWYDMTSILQWMTAEGITCEEGAGRACTAWLYALAGFGWGDVAVDPEGNPAFRWTLDPASLLFGPQETSGMEHEPLYVQPDFDIICPPGVPYIRRWKLLAIADLVQCDRVSVYRLTKSSAARAVENGLDTAEILDFLAESSAADIPGHVTAALRQWGKELGRTRFDEVLLLSCAGEEEGNAIAAHPQLGDEAERIGPRHFIVKASNTSRLRKLLEGMGLAPLKAMGSRDGEPSEYPLLHDVEGRMENASLLDERLYENQGMVYSGRNVHFFEPDHDIPAPISLFPGYERIPSRWLQDYRSYHASTAQNIVEQAQSWQTRVLLQHKGRTAEFSPLSIGSGPWRAEGILHDLETGRLEQLELCAEDLRELKLLLPAFE